MLRQSLLFQFKHGDHICVFYRSEDSLREVLTPYIADGLRRSQKCFCAQKPHIAGQLLNDLRAIGINTTDAIRRGALEIHTEDEVYFRNRKFEPRAMINMLARALKDAQEMGFSGLRTAGEMSWAMEGRNSCDQMLEYEQMVEELFPGKPGVGLCQYNLNTFPPQILAKVIDAHRCNLTEPSCSPIHSAITVRSGNYWSEIVADKLVRAPNYYYVVQRRKPSEVVGWGVARDFDSAHTKAKQIIQGAGL
jgi:hypothetical protein